MGRKLHAALPTPLPPQTPARDRGLRQLKSGEHVSSGLVRGPVEDTRTRGREAVQRAFYSSCDQRFPDGLRLGSPGPGRSHGPKFQVGLFKERGDLSFEIPGRRHCWRRWVRGHLPEFGWVVVKIWGPCAAPRACARGSYGSQTLGVQHVGIP